MLGAGITLAWAGDLLVFMMAPCANGIRMLHGLGRHKKRILAMIGMAMAIGLVGGVYAILNIAYQYGANNFHGSCGRGLPRSHFASRKTLHSIRWGRTGRAGCGMGLGQW